MSKKVLFVDLEVDINDKKIHDFGALRSDGSVLHSHSAKDFADFIDDSPFICGHNLVHHDLTYLRPVVTITKIPIDTLYLSPLLFPKKPYHKLLKNDKLQVAELNNPVQDCQKCQDLFYDEVNAFEALAAPLQQIFCDLLFEFEEFSGFFQYLEKKVSQAESRISLKNLFTNKKDIEKQQVANDIATYFSERICANAPLLELVTTCPRELAYALALIETNDSHSVTPPWLLFHFPRFEFVLLQLRNTPCKSGCSYCQQRFDPRGNLSKFFGFKDFRTYNGEPLQEQAVRTAVAGDSLLAIFPTGGGKSLTFQLPALIAAQAAHALTVVISPLQSLMKDQVDHLAEAGITEAVTINGMLDPISRAKAIEQVADGTASLLYIAPESLRSNTICKLLSSRQIARFVIDEAHCFSAWGQDFRVDYLYIGDFIRKLEKQKGDNYRIPVSCFTATAKQKVVSDICDYFKNKLETPMRIIASNASRENLHYAVLYAASDAEKYEALRRLLSGKDCPTIVYVSRTKSAENLASKLCKDGFSARPYHGKMDSNDKIEIQNAFTNNEIRIIVATSAFGMGVDKKDVGLVIHHDISDSLENYVQEAGRAGRDPMMQADCYVLFNDSDLDQHFLLLNQTKLSISQIQQVWKAIKDLSKKRNKVCCSALEIARQSGWEESPRMVETLIRSAIAALEQAGLVQRGNNVPRVYATSILVKNMEEAATKLQDSKLFGDVERQNAIRIIKSLISARSVAKAQDDEAESRVDYLADILGLEKTDVVNAVNKMRQEKILADTFDMSAQIIQSDSVKSSVHLLEQMAKLERFLNTQILPNGIQLTLKELNELALKNGIANSNVKNIRILLNFLIINKIIKKQEDSNSGNVTLIPMFQKERVEQKFECRISLCRFIIQQLFLKAQTMLPAKDGSKPVVFSVVALLEKYNQQPQMDFGNSPVHLDDVQDALLYLSKIGCLRLEGGFMVLYNSLEINVIAERNRGYKIDDYKLLNEFYKQKIQQIHIVGEYANLMVRNYDAALKFVHDYFHLDFKKFISTYFKGERGLQIDKNITPEKYRQLFGELSARQLEIINDKSKRIVVAAGPGSGKTRVLVHKLASLLLMEDVKSEQLLMLTFSRAAAIEFKSRLIDLIGPAAYYVEIKTFHSFCFDLLGKNGNLEEVQDVVKTAVEKIRNDEVEAGKISKSVVVVDEAQDMDVNEFALLRALMEHNEKEMRLIAVGDDDQNIYEFRGSNSNYFKSLLVDNEVVSYEMTENYRSCCEVVLAANTFAKQIRDRMKTTPIQAASSEDGEVIVVRHHSQNLEVPLVKHLLKRQQSGRTCVLTSTNDEALRVLGLLLHNNLKAKLIQSSDGFRFFDLVEVRYFLNCIDYQLKSPLISDEQWNNAKNALHQAFSTSANWDLISSFIDKFETVYQKKYRSDLRDFVMESQLEDFCEDGTTPIFVSTIHKSKGREFDQVFMLLDGVALRTDEERRRLYVGMTRAKKSLVIHCNNDVMDCLQMPDIQWYNDVNAYQSPEKIMLHLSHRDVYLDFCRNYQQVIGGLRSGQPLQMMGDGLSVIYNGVTVPVVKYSRAFGERLEKVRSLGYEPHSAVIRFIVLWRGENDAYETAIVLPTLTLQKKNG